MRASRAHYPGLSSAQRASSRPRCPSYLHHRPRPQSQCLHTSPSRSAKHKSPYRSITQTELKRIADARASLFPQYTKEERETVRHTYIPEQQRSIDLGEAAVDPYDLSRAKPRRDVLRPKNIDPHGYSRLQPVIDKRPSTSRGEWDNTDDNQPTANLDFLPDDEKKIERIGDILSEPSEDPYEEGAVDPLNPDKTKRDYLADLWHMAKTGQTFDPKNKAFDEFRFAEQEEDIEEGEGEDEGEPDVIARSPRRSQRSTPRVIESDADNTSDALQTDEDRLLQRIADNLPQNVRDRDRSRLSVAERLENALRWRDHPDPPELAQDIPKINDPRWIPADDSQPNEEEEGKGDGKAGDDEGSKAWDNLAKAMGKPVNELQRYRMKCLVQKRVVNQTRLGKIDSQYVLYVCGDEKGMVGIGEGKAAEVEVALRTAQINAVRSMKPIRRYEKRTIFGEVIGKVGAVELKLNARPPGFGLRCSSYAYEISKCAGLQDLQAKSLRSRNPMNVCKAMVQALQMQKDPEDVARARGKKLVDVRKVYYAGLV